MTRKGYKFTEEHKKKISIARKGFKCSEETKAKMRLIHGNRSEETRKRLSKSHKGVKLSEEHKRRIGLALMGKKRSEQTKAKMRLNHVGMIGKTLSKEAKQKMISSLTGRIISEETKAKMRLARRNQILPKKDTTIEIKIQNFLKQLGVEFFTHQYIHIEHGYQCDILIPSKKIVIECYGTYWHKYPYGNEVDSLRCQELREKGYKVFVFWENEIKLMTIDDFSQKLMMEQIKYLGGVE